MDIKVKVGGLKGNADQLAAVEAILGAVDGVELVSTSKLAYNKYYQVTVKADDTLTDADGDLIEIPEDEKEKVSYMKTKQVILDEKELFAMAVSKGLATSADRKAKRISVVEISRSEYSQEVNGYDMQDEKVTYTIIDTRGLCSVIGSFTTQLVLKTDEDVFNMAVKKGILQKVNLRSEHIAYEKEVEGEED